MIPQQRTVAGARSSSLGRPRLSLLGGFQLADAEEPIRLPLNGQRLLAYLGVRGRSARAVVAGTLWPEVTDRNAYGCLRTTMWRLHQAGHRLIDSTPEGLGLGAQVSVDVHAFTDLALRALRRPELLDTVFGEDEPGTGELLPGWYDDWVIFERERLRQLRLHMLEALAQRLSEQGRYAHALDVALDIVRIEPLRESAHRAVIAIHLAENNTVEALRHYSFVREMLHRELGIEPSEQLVAMLPPGPRERLRRSTVDD